MGAKRPQPTAVLVKRLQRVAKALDKHSHDPLSVPTNAAAVSLRAWANTCWQAAARLEEIDILRRVGEL